MPQISVFSTSMFPCLITCKQGIFNNRGAFIEHGNKNKDKGYFCGIIRIPLYG